VIFYESYSFADTLLDMNVAIQPAKTKYMYSDNAL